MSGLRRSEWVTWTISVAPAVRAGWTARNNSSGPTGGAAKGVRLFERHVTREMDLFFHPKVRVEDFEAATMPHFPDLYRTARLLAQDSAEAEDLVQEVYLQAWKSFHRFEIAVFSIDAYGDLTDVVTSNSIGVAAFNGVAISQ